MASSQLDLILQLWDRISSYLFPNSNSSPDAPNFVRPTTSYQLWFCSLMLSFRKWELHSPTTRSADKFVKTLLQALLVSWEIRCMCCYWTTSAVILFRVIEINLLSPSHPRDDEPLISKTPIRQIGSGFGTKQC